MLQQHIESKSSSSSSTSGLRRLIPERGMKRKMKDDVEEEDSDCIIVTDELQTPPIASTSTQQCKIEDDVEEEALESTTDADELQKSLFAIQTTSGQKSHDTESNSATMAQISESSPPTASTSAQQYPCTPASVEQAGPAVDENNFENGTSDEKLGKSRKRKSSKKYESVHNIFVLTNTKFTNQCTKYNFLPEICPIGNCIEVYDSISNMRRHTTCLDHKKHYELLIDKPVTKIFAFRNRTGILDVCPFCYAYIEGCNLEHIRKHLKDNKEKLRVGESCMIPKWPHLALAMLESIAQIQSKKVVGHYIDAELLINGRLSRETYIDSTEYQQLVSYVNEKGKCFTKFTWNPAKEEQENDEKVKIYVVLPVIENTVTIFSSKLSMFNYRDLHRKDASGKRDLRNYCFRDKNNFSYRSDHFNDW